MTGEDDEACRASPIESAITNDDASRPIQRKRNWDQLVAVDRAAAIIEETMRQKPSSQLGVVGFHTGKDLMSKNVNIHFKCQGRMYSLMMKASVEEVTLPVLEARICRKVALDESTVKLRLSYIPLLVGFEEQFTISDDEDLCVYLTSADRENRRCVLYVEVITITEHPEQLSRAGEGSSLGINYEELNSKDDEIGALYVKQIEMMEEDEDEYVAARPVSEASQCVEAWEDGLNITIQQEFADKMAVQEVVYMAACSNGFVFDVKKSDKQRLVLKCPKEGCKWGLRASKIEKNEMFSIRSYTKMHTCSRDGQSKSKRGKVTPQLVASLLHEAYPGEMQTLTPKSIIDFVWTKLSVKISYATAWRGKSLYSGSLEDDVAMLKNE
ncbi:PREDICTED: uncharacterized protein LOC106313520 isoform X2 [Brassica oleracea var. oleracea]|uniref:uncharacterized protein LOC106313520 isoform X2 n=1 Tax=Brassica oleracea var. oleracea TaxID=109376 RepID=UPI0006A71900|nr:PREDICTED: uncharacterized protein LOC106313520 isoform X2 [Brassica oleracea var. oleracea]